jgi:hypothetical protein
MGDTLRRGRWRAAGVCSTARRRRYFLRGSAGRTGHGAAFHRRNAVTGDDRPGRRRPPAFTANWQAPRVSQSVAPRRRAHSSAPSVEAGDGGRGKRMPCVCHAHVAHGALEASGACPAHRARGLLRRRRGLRGSEALNLAGPPPRGGRQRPSASRAAMGAGGTRMARFADPHGPEAVSGPLPRAAADGS